LTPDKSLPSPDITLYLTLPPSEASARSDYGQERYESLSIQTRVRAEFDRVAERVQSSEVKGNGIWVGVDAAGTIEVVRERIWGQVEGVLDGEKGEVGKLWND
jgi:dTMP kinase